MPRFSQIVFANAYFSIICFTVVEIFNISRELLHEVKAVKIVMWVFLFMPSMSRKIHI